MPKFSKSFSRTTGTSSWFGFSLLIRPCNDLWRKNVIEKLRANDIECRPIVAGNFVKNEVIKFFDYEVHGDLKNARHLDQDGFFVGNHHTPLEDELKHLRNVLTI